MIAGPVGEVGSVMRAVVFDIDGTLVDSTYLHTLAWWQALRSHGHDVPMAAVHRAIGRGGDRILDHLVPERDRTRDDDLRDGHARRYARHRPELRPFDGASELLRACKDAGAAIGLASSASQEELDVLLGVLDCADVVDVATSSDDVDRSKPDPDVLQVVLDRLGVAPEAAVLVGDSVWDVLAAGRAGMRCIGVPCGGAGAGELLGAGAVSVHSGPRDQLEHQRRDSAVPGDGDPTASF